jgi:hypothetical protein
MMNDDLRSCGLSISDGFVRWREAIYLAVDLGSIQ